MTALQLTHIEELFSNAPPRILAEQLDQVKDRYAMYLLQDRDAPPDRSDAADHIYFLRLLRDTLRSLAEQK